MLALDRLPAFCFFTLKLWVHSQHLKTDIDQFVKSAAMEMVVQQFGFTATSAKRYLRQLTAFGYLEAKGGNKNRTYTKLVEIKKYWVQTK